MSDFSGDSSLMCRWQSLSAFRLTAPARKRSQLDENFLCFAPCEEGVIVASWTSLT